MADMNLTADVIISRVDATAISKALISEFERVSGSISSDVKKQTGGEQKEKQGIGGGGDIAAAIQIIFKDAFNDLVKIIQDVVKALLILVSIGLVLKIIADVITAFWNGFKTLGMVWGTIMDLISKLVEPFVNLLIPPLLPFIFILSQVGRLLNLMLMPLFTILMKAFAGSGDVWKTVVEKLMGGDIMGAITAFVEGFAKINDTLKDDIVNYLKPLFQLLGKWIMGFLSLDINKIKTTLVDLLGEQLGGVIGFFVEVMYKVISALMGFVAQFVGGEKFNEVFGEGSFENIKKTNEGFAAGVGIATTIQQLIDAVQKVVKVIIGVATGAIPLEDILRIVAATLVGFIATILTTVVEGLRQFAIALIESKNKIANLFLQAVLMLASALITFVLEYIPKMVTAVNKFTAAIDYFSTMLELAGRFAMLVLTPGAGVEASETMQRMRGARIAEVPEATAESIFGEETVNSFTNLQNTINQEIEALQTDDTKTQVKLMNETFALLQADIQSFKTNIQTEILGTKLIESLANQIKGVGTETDKWSLAMSKLNPADYMRQMIDLLISRMEAEAQAAADIQFAASHGYDPNLTPTQNYLRNQAATQGDFIMRPGQGAIPFSAGDTVIGVNDLGSLGGSNVYNINIYGNGERFIAETVRNEIERVNSTTSRSGFFQRGY